MRLLSVLTKLARKSSAESSDVRAGFMGKIPARADYVRHNAGASEIKQLDQWIHEGIAYIARRFPSDWKDRLGKFGQIRCYIGGEGAIPALCGVICASQDKSGRQHPFMEFATCPNTHTMQSLPFVALRFSKFYTSAGKLNMQDGSDLDVDHLIKQNDAMRRLISTFAESMQIEQRNESWAGRSNAEFWEYVLPGACGINRLNFARDILQTLKMAANRGPERIAWGVRLPIAQGAASNALVSFWLSLFVGVLGQYKWRPHIFWNQEKNGTSSLTVYFRSPNASSFAQLICPGVDEGGVVDVVRRPLENLPEITSAGLKKLVGNDTLTWSEMLENWLKG